MDPSQAGNAEDWEMIKKAMASMEAAVNSSSAPQAKGGEVSKTEILKEIRLL